MSSQRDLGRLDEIAVLDLDQVEGSSRRTPRLRVASESVTHTATAPGNGTGLPRAGREEEEGGRNALAALCALLKGLSHALMLRNQEIVSSGGGENPHLLSTPLWMPELAVPESLMLAVYPGVDRGSEARRSKW